MTVLKALRAVGLAALLALPAAAQDTGASTTTDDLRAEISDAMDAVADYSAQERDQALAEAREALTRLDAEIERREQALRESAWDLSETARETARARLEDLRIARDRLGERYDALEAGADDAWDELKTGFTNAWGAVSDAWRATDEDTSAD